MQGHLSLSPHLFVNVFIDSNLVSRKFNDVAGINCIAFGDIFVLSFNPYSIKSVLNRYDKNAFSASEWRSG